MPLMSVKTTLTANGTARPLVGQTFETLTAPSAVWFAVYGDTAAVVNATIASGADVLMDLSLLPILAVASPIIVPDHYVLRDVAGRGEKINILLQEAAGATPVVRTNVLVTPVM